MLNNPKVSYLICATPRSGSTLLCEALKNTGLAGNPDEYFGPMHVSRWNEKWQTSDNKEYLQHVLEHGSSPNQVWGCKVMRVYWQDFLSQLKQIDNTTYPSDAALLQAHFPNLKYIFMTRRNKVRQAISWLKFLQGLAWYWENDEPQQLQNLTFKPDVIDDFLSQTATHESAWLEFFNQAGVQPYVVTYEDFENTYEETATNILDFLGIKHTNPVPFKKRRIKKQADELTEEWVQKYLDSKKHTEQFS